MLFGKVLMLFSVQQHAKSPHRNTREQNPHIFTHRLRNTNKKTHTKSIDYCQVCICCYTEIWKKRERERERECV